MLDVSSPYIAARRRAAEARASASATMDGPAAVAASVAAFASASAAFAFAAAVAAVAASAARFKSDRESASVFFTSARRAARANALDDVRELSLRLGVGVDVDVFDAATPRRDALRHDVVDHPGAAEYGADRHHAEERAVGDHIGVRGEGRRRRSGRASRDESRFGG